MTFKKQILRIQLPALLWAILIYILCVTDTQQVKLDISLLGVPIDKIAHFGVFLILSFLMSWGVFAKHNWLSTKCKSWIIFISITYGVLIEFMQFYLTIDRKADIFDIFADSIGTFVGVFIFVFFKKNKNLANKL
ncbi:MAG: VanZ family protein [Bacteroidetes bacterium]|nr:VanZ family protein [Bacteroidota bacterium]